jgi:cephalosporin hydroxylase
MDELEIFAADRESTIGSYHRDETFRADSRAWLLQAMQKRYVYNFDWLGRPVIQFPQDLVGLQEIIWSTKPDVIIETGIAHGGSIVFSASMLAMLDYADAAERGATIDPRQPTRRVIGVDIDIRAHNRSLIEAHPFAASITMIEGSSIDPATVDAVRAQIPDGARVMVCLDSHHEHDHVIGELDSYAPMVTPGCFCVVLDTFIEDAPKGFIPDRPWDKGNNPKTAVHAWLAHRDDFVIDRDLAAKLMLTGAPDGFLRRVR